MLQLDAAALAARLDRRALIDALDGAFRRPHSVPARRQYTVEPAIDGQAGTLLVMPAWTAGGALGIKLVTVFPDNALRGLPAVCASYLLFDATNGQARAILDGTELTLRRTGAASALASRYLSAPDAARLLMVGSGRLAPHLIESHALVRPIREVRIWGRHADRARALAATLTRSGLSVEGHPRSRGGHALGRHRELRDALAAAARSRQLAQGRTASRSGRGVHARHARGR